MSDKEAFEKWAAEIDLGDNLVFDTSSGCVGVKDMVWQAWQAAQTQAGELVPVAEVRWMADRPNTMLEICTIGDILICDLEIGTKLYAKRQEEV